MSSTLERSLETAPPELDETAVRAALEEALAADKRPLAQVAPEIGIPYGTVSAWRGGKYNGDTSRVATAVQAWLTSRDARANARATLPVEPGFVMTQTASQIWELCEFAMTTPAIGVVIGGAGVGKTSGLEAYRDRLPQTVWIATLQPCHNTLAAVLREVAFAVNATAPHRSYDIARSIIHRIRGTRGLLVIDEGQHAASEALDQLRSIFDATKTGLVLAGNKELSAHMGADRRRDQLAQIYSRIGIRLQRERAGRAAGHRGAAGRRTRADHGVAGCCRHRRRGRGDGREHPQGVGAAQWQQPGRGSVSHENQRTDHGAERPEDDGRRLRNGRCSERRRSTSARHGVAGRHGAADAGEGGGDAGGGIDGRGRWLVNAPPKHAVVAALAFFCGSRGVR
jgi:DNA transposition AAA+ family ATPase